MLRTFITRNQSQRQSLASLCRTMSSQSAPQATLQFVHPSAAQSEANRLWATAWTESSTKALDERILFRENEITSLVSLGEAQAWSKKTPEARREAIRAAAGKGVGKLRDVAKGAGIKSIQVDAAGDAVDAHAAAVGAKLGLHSFTLKTKKDANPGKGAYSYIL